MLTRNLIFYHLGIPQTESDVTIQLYVADF